jgi:hypothetical protein
MSASKNRLRWHELPGPVRERIARLSGAPVLAATNCPGGFSPGLASRLTLADGRRVFVKALDCAAWPAQADMYRDEARVADVLPAGLPAPEFLGRDDDGSWVILGFTCIEGKAPVRPWRVTDLARVVEATPRVAVRAPSLGCLPARPVRLGGWADVAADRARVARLRGQAAGRLADLVALERRGLAAACGDTLAHFDMFDHNILLTSDRVLFVDWAHARLGSPLVDTVLLLASAAADGIDPEPFLATSPLAARADPDVIDGLLAAQAGFCLRDGLLPPEPGLEPIYAAKLELGLAALAWLMRRRASVAR